jgi:ferritin-like metal-binding protein YciE
VFKKLGQDPKAWAEELGHDEIVRTNLNEEKAANTKLSTVTERTKRHQGAA